MRSSFFPFKQQEGKWGFSKYFLKDQDLLFVPMFICFRKKNHMIVNSFFFTKNWRDTKIMKTSHAHCSLTQHALTPPLAPLATHFGPEVRAAAAFPVPPKKNRTRNRLGASFGQNKFRINPLSDSEEISKTTDLLDFLFVPFFYYERLNGGKGMNASLSLFPSKPVWERAERERERERERGLEEKERES